MGTLKTTNIQTITGSGTLTLGTSGETVALGSGATASGFGGLVKVSEASGTALSSQASLEVALPETYRAFKMYLDIKPETDAVHLQATLSVDDGSSYYTSSNNYQYGYQHIYAHNTAHDVIYSNGDTKIELTKDGGNNTANAEGHHMMFDIKPINTESSVNQHNHITWEGSRNDGNNAFRTIRGSGVLAATYTNKINKIKLAYDSGNIEDYFVTLYGFTI